MITENSFEFYGALFIGSRKLKVGIHRFEVISTLKIYLSNYVLYGYRFYSQKLPISIEDDKEVVRRCFNVMACCGHVLLLELLSVTNGVFPNFGMRR